VSVTILLPLPPVELQPNRRPGWRLKARVTANARLFAAYTAATSGKARIPMERCRVVVTFRYPDARRRDIQNGIAAMKSYIDGIVDAGVMRDDSCIQSWEVRAVIDRANPGLTVEVWEA